MKFFVPAALAVLATAVSAAPEVLPNTFAAAAQKCVAESKNIPPCAVKTLNTISKKVCKDDYDLDCACTKDHIEKILSLGADSFKKECGTTPVDAPVEEFCSCYRGDKPTPTKTTTSVKPTSTCAAEEKKIPTCAVSCVNTAAAKLCKPGDLECGCNPETLDKIIKNSKDCVADACKDAGPVFPPLKAWCACVIGGGKPTSSSTSATTTTTSSTKSQSSSHSSSSTASVTSTKGSTISTDTSTASSTPTNSVNGTSTATGSTSAPATLTSTFTTTTVYTVTSCAPEITNCPARVTTETVVVTTTYCPGSETPKQTQPVQTQSPVTSTGSGRTTKTTAPISTGAPIKTQAPPVAGAAAQMQGNICGIAVLMAMVALF